QNKKTIITNATLQQIMPRLLQEVLPGCELLHVRENASKLYLESLGIKSFATTDLAFLSLNDESEPRIKLLDAQAHVLVTGGVLINEEALNHLLDAVNDIGMRSVYFSIGDGGETELARRVCSFRNVPMVNANELGLKETIGFLKHLPRATSGRPHIHVFLMRACVPFLPLHSNTWKVEETLSLVDYPISPVKTYEELTPTLTYVLHHREYLSSACVRSYELGRASAETLLTKWPICP